MALDVFHDDDGIVDDNANGENEPEQADRVDREAKHEKGRERPNERNRDRDGRYERRSPILQKNEDDENDQRKRLQQRNYDLAYGRFHIKRRVVCDLECEIVGEALGQPFHLGFDILRNVKRIGVGQLVDRKNGGGLPVELSEPAIVFGAKLDRGHVL